MSHIKKTTFFYLLKTLIIISTFFGLTPVFAAPEAPDLNVKLGSNEITLSSASCSGGNCTFGWISDYISQIYQYGVGIAGILAVIMIMIGGFVWLMSAGRSEQVGKAKEYIVAALSGLFLAMFSFMILYYVNPDLVAMKGVSIRGITGYNLPTVEDQWRGGVVGTDPSPESLPELAYNLTINGVNAEVMQQTYNGLRNACNCEFGARQFSNFDYSLVGGGTVEVSRVEFQNTPEFQQYLVDNGQIGTINGRSGFHLAPGVLEWGGDTENPYWTYYLPADYDGRFGINDEGQVIIYEVDDRGIVDYQYFNP